jgi:hypothetical protein
MRRCKNLYDNCLIQAPDGTPVSRCLRSRLDWYLSRGLATRIDENTIRLHKQPSGCSHVKEATEVKINICVVCGGNHKLSIHHVVPYCFRNALPLEWRASSALYHDTVALCDECHRQYEIHGNRLKRDLANRFGISEHGYGVIIEGRRTTMRSYARTLLGMPPRKKKRKRKFYFNPPPERRQELISRITEYIGHEPTNEELLEMTEWNAVIKGSDYVPYGKYIVDRFDPAELVLMWRSHFLDTMKPKFMPDYWSLDRLPTKAETEHLLRELQDDPKEIRWRFRSTSA